MKAFISKPCRGLRQEIRTKADEEVLKAISENEMSPIEGEFFSATFRPFLAGKCLVKSASGQCLKSCYVVEALKE